MDSVIPTSSGLQSFLLDAQALLSRSQECVQHLELIDNDADACHSLNNALDTLARRAGSLGLGEIAHFAAGMQQLLDPACQRQHLKRAALPALDACLTLLAWQLELTDASTGQLNLDSGEQIALLNGLATALEQPLPHLCAPCQDSDSLCAHPHPAEPSKGLTPQVCPPASTAIDARPQ
ncbi:histidine kinase [Pseudomonas putida]